MDNMKLWIRTLCMDFLLGYWYFLTCEHGFKYIFQSPLLKVAVFTSQILLPKQFIFPSVFSLPAALSSYYFLVVFVFHCHKWRPGAWKTVKYWILFYLVGTWSKWFLFHCWEVLKLGRLAAICSSWSLLTVSFSGKCLLWLGNVKWLL